MVASKAGINAANASLLVSISSVFGSKRKYGSDIHNISRDPRNRKSKDTNNLTTLPILDDFGVNGRLSSSFDSDIISSTRFRGS